MVPVRFVSEKMGSKLEWDPNTFTASITSSAPPVSSTTVMFTYDKPDNQADNEFMDKIFSIFPRTLQC
ncbi:stalk domain-containing protein [Paenibacillus alginolyticus]|uniref:stalk domain-containing protein n=1 Tax=Paenibacillus alginolyticus TaxID=59839 RepID=UPI0034DAE238